MTDASGGRPLVVLHSTAVWLPRTMPWLHDIVRFLPPHVESHVVAERSVDGDRFAVERLHLPARAGPVARLRQRLLWRLGRTPATRHVTSVARRVRPAVVHSHFGTRAWGDRRAVDASGARHLVGFYGLDVDQVPRSRPVWVRRYRRLFDDVDAVLVLGRHMAGRLLERGCPGSKIVVHHVGVDVRAIPYRPRVWNGEPPLRILMAASFREKKGIPDGLEVAARLRRRTSVAVTLIGDVTDEPRSRAERDRIHATISRLGLGDDVRLLGYQPREAVFAEARRHDLFLAPSVTAGDGDTEGTPVTIMEMMAAGIPVASTRHSDIPELVHHGRTGLLAPEHDPEALAATIEEHLGGLDRWLPMLDAARAHIEDAFDALKQGVTLARLYGDVVGGRSPGASPDPHP